MKNKKKEGGEGRVSRRVAMEKSRKKMVQVESGDNDGFHFF